MENIKIFLQEYDYILSFLYDISVLVLALSLAIKTKDINKFKEVLSNMKFRTENYKEGKPSEAQTFELYKKVYKLNPITEELELTDDKVDIQELIQSSVDTCMRNILDRLMPSDNSLKSDDLVSYNSMCDDLDFLNEMSDRAEFYREKLGLSDELSLTQVFDIVKDKADILKSKIESNTLKSEEASENAKKTEQESK